MSKILKVTKETVSIEQLKTNLPEGCYEAVSKSMNTIYPCNVDDSLNSIYEQYFSSPPVTPLTDKEQHELFEQLGNQWVKNHYSTETLRSFLDSEPSVKRGRNHE